MAVMLAAAPRRSRDATTVVESERKMASTAVTPVVAGGLSFSPAGSRGTVSANFALNTAKSMVGDSAGGADLSTTNLTSMVSAPLPRAEVTVVGIPSAAVNAADRAALAVVSAARGLRTASIFTSVSHVPGFPGMKLLGYRPYSSTCLYGWLSASNVKAAAPTVSIFSSLTRISSFTKGSHISAVHLHPQPPLAIGRSQWARFARHWATLHWASVATIPPTHTCRRATSPVASDCRAHWAEWRPPRGPMVAEPPVPPVQPEPSNTVPVESFTEKVVVLSTWWTTKVIPLTRSPMPVTSEKKTLAPTGNMWSVAVVTTASASVEIDTTSTVRLSGACADQVSPLLPGVATARSTPVVAAATHAPGCAVVPTVWAATNRHPRAWHAASARPLHPVPRTPPSWIMAPAKRGACGGMATQHWWFVAPGTVPVPGAWNHTASLQAPVLAAQVVPSCWAPRRAAPSSQKHLASTQASTVSCWWHPGQFDVAASQSPQCAAAAQAACVVMARHNCSSLNTRFCWVWSVPPPWPPSRKTRSWAPGASEGATETAQAPATAVAVPVVQAPLAVQVSRSCSWCHTAP
mmetsp:Transcript_69399/g.159425  ORF Transcript_69399/g.159425 Transcript_69399/m.159425 type:complete len:577 (-) Transcript_69399:603-2333(-)